MRWGSSSVRLRVLFVSQLAYRLFDPMCPSPFGGAELQMTLLARALAEDPHYDVHFLTQDFGQPKRQRKGDLTLWRYKRPFKGVRMLTVVRRGWSILTMSTTMVRIRPDVIVDSPAGFSTAAASAAARLTGAAHIFRLASDGDLDGSIFRNSGERRLFLWGLRRADGLIARNRKQMAELLERYGKQSVILPNAFPVPDKEPVHAKDGVLWVASAQNLKQPWVFLDLAGALPGVRFRMIMPPNDLELFNKTRSQVLDLPNVDFLESVAFEDIQSYFDRARVFVNTSTVEGFPNTFVQAAMAATPVLSLNVDPDGVLAENGFGRCAQGDQIRLSQDLQELLSDEELCVSMGRCGLEYARRTHDIRVVMDQFRGLLESARIVA